VPIRAASYRSTAITCRAVGTGGTPLGPRSGHIIQVLQHTQERGLTRHHAGDAAYPTLALRLSRSTLGFPSEREIPRQDG
jgi:hypothetical protein